MARRCRAARPSHTFADLFGGPARLLAGEGAQGSTCSCSTRRISTTGRATRMSGRTAQDWPDNALRFAALARCGATSAGRSTELRARHRACARLAGGPGAGLSALCRRAAPGDGHDRPQSRLPGAVSRAPLGRSACRRGLRLRRHRVLRQHRFSEGRPPARRPDHHGSPTYAAEIRTPRPGWGSTACCAARAGVSARHPQRHRHAGVESRRPIPHLAAAYDAEAPAGAQAATRRRCSSASGCERTRTRSSDRRRQPPLLAEGARPAARRLARDARSRRAARRCSATGDPALERGFAHAVSRCIPAGSAAVIGYDEALAHLIQAGVDALLVPSRFEPCGLTQLCALRYGAVPVVARVGGLADTVIDANEMALARGVGDRHAVRTGGPRRCSSRLAAHRRGSGRDKPAWRRMQTNGMATSTCRGRGPQDATPRSIATCSRSAREHGRRRAADMTRMPEQSAGCAAGLRAGCRAARRLALGRWRQRRGLFGARRAHRAVPVRCHAGAEIARVHLPHRTGDVFHAHVPGIAPGSATDCGRMAPSSRERGLRFNPAKLLSTPMRRARPAVRPAPLDVRLRGRRSVRDLRWTSGQRAVRAERRSWKPLTRRVQAARPRVPWDRTLVYELHVRGFSQRIPAIRRDLRGTFAGLAHPRPRSQYLAALGVTTVELMPVAAWVGERHLSPLGSRTTGATTPRAARARSAARPRRHGRGSRRRRRPACGRHRGDRSTSCSTTPARATNCGPTLSLRGLDNATYYRLTPDEPRCYIDDTGCGNTLALDRPPVAAPRDGCAAPLGGSAGIDGFRFDLATDARPRAPRFRPCRAALSGDLAGSRCCAS